MYYGSYKYVVSMPPRVRTVEYIKQQFTETHIDVILTKKVELLISPIYISSHREMYYQPIIDIDFTDSSYVTAFVTVRKIIHNVKNSSYSLKNFIVEYTGTGYHIVMNKAFKTTKKKIDTHRHLCSRLSEYIDCTSSFRETPIRRIGGYKKNYVIYPIAPSYFLNNKPHEPKKFTKHLDVMDKKTWIKNLSYWLLPSEFIDNEFEIDLINI